MELYGQPFRQVDTSNRAERWLYRPLGDLLMLPAIALGFAFSGTAVVFAWPGATGRWRAVSQRGRPSLASAHQELSS